MKTAKEILQSHYAFPIERNQSAGYNFRWGHIIDFMEEYALQFHPKEMTDWDEIEKNFSSEQNSISGYDPSSVNNYYERLFKYIKQHYSFLPINKQQPEQQGD